MVSPRTTLLAGALVALAAGGPAQMKWTKLPGTTPPARRDAALAYDTIRHHLVLFGGRDATAVTGETWEWNALAWQRLRPTVEPGPREHHAMAYDPVRNRTVLFGGRAGLGAFDDTWEWDGTTWTKMTPKTVPPGRSEHAMAYDARAGGVVMFGGADRSITTLLGDVWVWDGKDWSQKLGGPKPRRQHGLAQDALGRLLLCGGLTSDWPTIKHAPTWTWDGAQWTLQKPNQEVVAGLGKGAALDLERGLVCLLALPTGNDPTIWEWNGIDWKNRVVAGGPLDGPHHLLSYHRLVRGVVVITPGDFGRNLPTETWLYEPTQRAKLELFGSPCAGSAGAPYLGADTSVPFALPWVGGQLSLIANTLPANAPSVLLIGASNSRWGSTPLPFSLAALGATGCFLRASPDVALPLRAGGNGDLRFLAAIPDNPWLIGKQVYHQLAVADAAANALGVVTTNGVTATFGGR